MPGQEIRPIDDGVQLIITDEAGDTYTITFHCPPNEELHLRANDDGSFEMEHVDSEGNRKALGLSKDQGEHPLGK